MAAKVTLLIRIVKNGRRTYATPIWAANRRLRSQYAQVHGRPEHHPEGVYYLRCQRKFEKIGPDAAAALNALRLKEHSMGIMGLLGPSGVASRPVMANESGIKTLEVEKHRRFTWESATREYMLEIEGRRSRRTAVLYRAALDEFAAANRLEYLDQITRTNLLALDAYVRRKGNSARTAYGHMVAVGTFLRHFGYDNVMRKRDLPRFTPKMAVAYDEGELQKLFTAASAIERLLFRFLLQTGFRQQEAMYVTVRDVDFRSGLVRVRAKPQYKWEPKDREERDVPVPDDLLAALQEHVASTGTQNLLFPTASGKPDSHMLRKLKRTAFRAGLNCGHCVSQSGMRCSDHPVCKRWELHTFRRTFATFHHEAGVSIRVLADWLGHAEISTTWGYLAVADKRSAKTRAAVNSSFLALAG